MAFVRSISSFCHLETQTERSQFPKTSLHDALVVHQTSNPRIYSPGCERRATDGRGRRSQSWPPPPPRPTAAPPRPSSLHIGRVYWMCLFLGPNPEVGRKGKRRGDPMRRRRECPLTWSGTIIALNWRSNMAPSCVH